MGKYRYDKEQLKFVEDKRTIKDFIKKILWLFISSIVLSIVYYVLFAFVFNTDEEKRLQRENKAIAAEYDRLEERADLLDNVVSDLQSRDREIYREIFNSDPPYFISEYNDSLYTMHNIDSLGTGIIYYTADKVEDIITKCDKCVSVISYINQVLGDDTLTFTSIPSIIPVADFSPVQTGATIGKRVHPFYKTVNEHNGIDLITSVGTEVLASGNGVVSDVLKLNKIDGNKITIDHGNGYITTYSHLADLLVRKGQKVAQGAVIGRVGSTGISFAPHLHYEVLLEGAFQDPINYFFADISPTDYREMMIIAINTGQSLD